MYGTEREETQMEMTEQYPGYNHRVQYYETDQMGCVHHSNYIRWFEESRSDYLGYHIRDKKDGTLRCSGQTSHCFLNREGKPLSLKKEKPEWHEILKRECERAQEQNG